MKYIQDSDGNTITVPNDVQLFKRVVLFTNFAIAGDFSSDFEITNNSEHRATLSIYGINQIEKLIQKPFHFFIDGNLVFDGRVFIRGVGDTIDLFFVAGNGNWMNQITGSLKDVDLSDYNVSFDAPTIISRMSATDGVIFPVIDWCYNYRKLTNSFMVSPITGVSIDTFYDWYACFHVKTILKRLLNSYGFILAGNLLDDTVYNSLIITPEEIQSAAYLAALSTQVSGVQYMDGSFENMAAGFPTFAFKAPMQSGTSYFEDANDRLTFPFTGTATITYSVSFGATTPFTINKLQLRKNGVTVSERTITSQVTNGSEVIEIVPGDYVELWLGTTSGTGVNYSASVNVSVNFIGIIVGDGVNVNAIIPNMDQIDFVKYVAQRFNCLIDFNESTQTLTFTLLDSIRKENAVDMTDRLVKYTYSPASGYKEKNYIRTTEAEELINYKSGSLNYGDSVVESDGDGEGDVVKTPLRPAETFTATYLDWLITSVPLVRLEDADTGTEFDTVSAFGGNVSAFTSTVSGFSFAANEVVRIDSSLYKGFMVALVATPSAFTPYGNVPYTGSDTGKIYKQKIVFLSIGSRELIVCRGVDISDINTGSQVYGDINIKIGDESVTYPIDEIAWAFHAKPNIGTDLDLHRVGLNYGPVTNTGNIPFGLKYHKNLNKIIKGSHLTCEMLLSQAQFANLDLKRFVYLNTKDASGYFLILDFQDGYTDAFTPVTMDLVYMGNG